MGDSKEAGSQKRPICSDTLDSHVSHSTGDGLYKDPVASFYEGL